VETAPELAVKVAEDLVAATFTEAGTLKTELVSESATVIPPVGAALEMVTVQVLLAFDARVVGLQVREETDTVAVAAVRLIVALAEVPLRLAVRLAV
jgi:hypothetical protein